MTNHRPLSLSACIGEHGATINYNNAHSHPLSFSFYWNGIAVPQRRPELVAPGKQFAAMLGASLDMLTALEEIQEKFRLSDSTNPDFADCAEIARLALAKTVPHV